MLVYDRTEFNDGHPKVFHVVSTSTSNTVYSDLCAKYGADNVKKSSNFQGIVDALAMCVSGRGDLIRIWPGTFTDNSGTDVTLVSIAKANITIESATKNAADVNLDAGSDAGIFSITAAGDGTVIRHLTLTLDVSATTPQDGIAIASGANGCVIEDCIFVGADKATVAIDSEGDRLTVKGCRFEDVKTAIQTNGNYCRILDNYINSDNTGAKGIEITGAAAWCEIRGNVLDLSGGTGDVGITLHTSSVLGICWNNVIHPSSSDAILPNSSTMMIFGNYESGSVVTDFTVTNATILPKLVYT